MPESGHDQNAHAYYLDVVSSRGELAEIASRLETEPDEVVQGVVRRLAGSNQALKAPAIQSILDHRQHAQQIASQSALRATMENVSATLLKVEENQRGLELANLALARSANRLGLVQVVVAVIFGIVGAMQACAPASAESSMWGSRSEIVSAPEPQHPLN